MRNPRKIAGLIVFLSILLFGVSQSFSQTTNWMANTVLSLFQNAPWKLGLARGYRAFSIGNAGYDSDIYYGFQDEEYPDFMFTAGPAFQWFVPLSKQVIFDSYQSLQGVFYFKYDQERTLNFSTTNQLHFLFKKSYGKTGLTYSNNRRRLSPELLLNVRQEEIAWDGFFLWQFSRKGAVAWQLRTSKFNYRQGDFAYLELDRVLNRNESYADVFIYLQPAARYRFYLNGQVGFYNFQYQESKFKDSRSYAAYSGIEFVPEISPVKTTFQGGFNIGYIYLEPKSPDFQEASGIVGNGDITINLSRWLSLRAYYARGFNVSIYSSMLHYLSTTYGGSLNFILTRKVSLGTYFTQGLTEYPFSQESDDNDWRYKYTTMMANIIIRLGRELNLNIFGTMSQRKMLPEELKFNRYFIGFNLTYGSVPGENILPVPSLL